MPTCLSCSQAAPEDAVNCPSCGQPLRSPCPICHEPILIQAIKCKFCKTILQEGPKLNPEELARVRKDLAALTASADEPADLNGQPGKISLGTIVSTVMCLGSVVVAIVTGMTNPDAGPVTGFAIFFAIIFFIAWIAFFGVDMSVPSAKGRRTGFKAVKCYLHAVKYRRWKTAFACLSPMARSKPEIEVPFIPGLNDPGRFTVFSSPSRLADYWRNLVHGSGFGTGRRIVRLKIEPRDSTDPHIERFHVSMKVEYYPTWVWLLIFIALIVAVIVYLIARRFRTFEFEMVAYKHKSQWWLMTGELDCPLDRDLQ